MLGPLASVRLRGVLPPAELPPADRSPTAGDRLRLRRAEVAARPLGVREVEPLPSLPPYEPEPAGEELCSREALAAPWCLRMLRSLSRSLSCLACMLTRLTWSGLGLG